MRWTIFSLNFCPRGRRHICGGSRQRRSRALSLNRTAAVTALHTLPLPLPGEAWAMGGHSGHPLTLHSLLTCLCLASIKVKGGWKRCFAKDSHTGVSHCMTGLCSWKKQLWSEMILWRTWALITRDTLLATEHLIHNVNDASWAALYLNEFKYMKKHR